VVRRNLGVGETAHDEVDGALRDRERRVQVPRELVVGSREVHVDALAVDRHRDADLDIFVGHAVALEHVGRLVGAVGERRDLAFDALARVVDHRVEPLEDGLAAVLVEQRLEPGLGAFVGRPLRPEVGPALARVAHVREDERADFLPDLPARDEPGRWEPESLLVDLPRVGRHAPGVIPPTSAWWARETA